jgi:Asp-tRNA(Asn)/Glu-tRNA(Gln) amidotransferase A subunit family amidase
MMLIGRSWADATVLRAADAWQQHVGQTPAPAVRAATPAVP